MPNLVNNNIILNDLNVKSLKKVISDEGKKSIKKKIFEKNKYKNEICPITHDEFKEGDKISILPCNHCFDRDSIDIWLETEKAECPICRKELDSIEVEKENIDGEELERIENNFRDQSMDETIGLLNEIINRNIEIEESQIQRILYMSIIDTSNGGAL